MKKILLGTSAIALVAASTGAFAADKMQLAIVGDTKFGLLLADTDTDGQRSSNFVQATAIDFKGETTLDNGIKVSVKVDDDFKGADVKFSGGFGTLAVGDTDSASAMSDVKAPSVAIGGGISGPDFTVGANTKYYDSVAGVAPKLVYSNTISGLTVALSYQTGGETSPDAPDEPEEGGLENATLLKHGDEFPADIFSFGAKFEGDFGGTKVKIGGGYEKGDFATIPGTLRILDLVADPTGGTPKAANLQYDFSEVMVMHFGAEVTVDTVTIGAGYSKGEREFSENTAKTNIDAADSIINWNVGAKYAIDALSFSIAYAYREDEEGRGTEGQGNEANYSTFEGAAAYDIGGGVSVSAAIASVDNENKFAANSATAATNTKHWYTTFMTKVEF
jgi:predicted porin